MPKELHVFGVRHHGPGSARAVLRALDHVRPQCVLIEGPPDADDIITAAAHDGMQPPVAILIYQANDPARAVYYPFAEFSPEWCAIRWSIANRTPVRFMDLPQSHHITETLEEKSPDELHPPRDADAGQCETHQDGPPSEEQREDARLRRDPLSALARVAGFDDGERWWEFTFEHRRPADVDVFTAVREAMEVLRRTPDVTADARNSRLSASRHDGAEPLREAWMRRTIRRTQREFDNVAVICGAWHVPALGEDLLKNSKKHDDTRLKSLAKAKTIATWIPWTYDRLAASSGYGAGVHSPGWYDHLWHCESHILERWMSRVGRLLRDADIDCSSAHIIEATRLATSLATIRNRPLADLSDIADACRAVFCFDSDLALRLIARKLLIGERLGEVPEDTPLVPLQQDLQRQQKSLRLKPEAIERTLDLDLRKETDLGRSVLLHRLRVLGIDWGQPQTTRSGKGTFHEIWKLRWEPTFLVRLIELGVWGNSIESAAAGYTLHLAESSDDLEKLTVLLGDVILANLPSAMERLLGQILTAAAVAADVAKLMDAFPPLANVFRYGNVRGTDQALVRRAIDGVLPRIIVGLNGAVSSLNDDAARQMQDRMVRVHEAVQLLDSTLETDSYSSCLAKIADQPTTHGLVRGRCTRLLFDHSHFTGEEVATRLSLMLSRGGDPVQAAGWIEGFLSNSGLILLHHADLLDLMDQWIGSISTDIFDEQVPLLRRTFSTFPAAERRQIGERLTVRTGATSGGATGAENVNPQRANRVLPILRIIFGPQSTGGSL